MQRFGLELSDHGTKCPDTMSYVELDANRRRPTEADKFKEESIALRVLSFLLVSGNRLWKP